MALDTDLRELDFWEMTPAEVNRAIESKNRRRKIEAKEKASFDYILANLIGKNISIVLNGKGELPPIREVYTGLFDEETEEQKEQVETQKANRFAMQLRMFADAHNKKLEKGGKNE